MFKKPTCPHCSAEYPKKVIPKLLHKKEYECYMCKEKFKVDKKGYILIYSLFVIFAILMNLFFIILLNMSNVVILLITDGTIIFLAYLCRIYFIKYKKLK